MSLAVRLACISLFAMAACQSAPQPRPDAAAQEEPTAKIPFVLTGANVTGQSLLDATLTVTGQVGPEVTDRTLRWEANAGSKVLGEGELTIQPDEEGQFSAPLVLTFGETIDDLQPYQSQESFEVVVTTTLGEFGASRSRSVRSPLLPVVSIATVRASRNEARAMALTYLVMVHNPNPFPVRVRNLSYTAQLQGKTVGTGEFSLGSALPGSMQSEFEVPAELNNENSDGTFNAILREKELEWRFSGAVETRAFPIPFDLSGTLPLAQG